MSTPFTLLAVMDFYEKLDFLNHFQRILSEIIFKNYNYLIQALCWSISEKTFTI